MGTNSTIRNAVNSGARAPPQRPPRATIELAAARPDNGIHLLITEALVPMLQAVITGSPMP
jgi:hypothetical protein